MIVKKVTQSGNFVEVSIIESDEGIRCHFKPLLRARVVVRVDGRHCTSQASGLQEC